MNPNRIAEPVQIRVAVVGAVGVQALATSNTGSTQTTTTTLIMDPLSIALPSLQVGDPILTGKQ